MEVIKIAECVEEVTKNKEKYELETKEIVLV